MRLCTSTQGSSTIELQVLPRTYKPFKSSRLNLSCRPKAIARSYVMFWKINYLIYADFDPYEFILNLYPT